MANIHPAPLRPFGGAGTKLAFYTRARPRSSERRRSCGLWRELQTCNPLRGVKKPSFTLQLIQVCFGGSRYPKVEGVRALNPGSTKDRCRQPPPCLPLHQSSIFPGYSKKILNESELPEKSPKTFLSDFAEVFD
jgi:hypothetical protein